MATTALLAVGRGGNHIARTTSRRVCSRLCASNSPQGTVPIFIQSCLSPHPSSQRVCNKHTSTSTSLTKSPRLTRMPRISLAALCLFLFLQPCFWRYDTLRHTSGSPSACRPRGRRAGHHSYSLLSHTGSFRIPKFRVVVFITATVWCVPFLGAVSLFNKLQNAKKRKTFSAHLRT